MEVFHSFKSNENEKFPNIYCVVMPVNISFQTNESYNFQSGFGTFFIQERPSSRCLVTLRSKEPTDDPIIQHNYLSNPSEIRELIDSIHLMRKVLSQPALAEYLTGEMSPMP